MRHSNTIGHFLNLQTLRGNYSFRVVFLDKAVNLRLVVIIGKKGQRRPEQQLDEGELPKYLLHSVQTDYAQ